jgi:putative ABC transport system substrate-binding protein
MSAKTFRLSRRASRRSFLRGIGACLALALSSPGNAQSQGEPKRIAWVSFPSRNPVEQENVLAFESHLAEQGWQIGKTAVVKQFRMMPSADRFEQRARGAITEVLAWRPAVIAAWGDASAALLKKADVRVPVVFLGAVDPVNAGLVASMRRPGGNLTGTTTGQDRLAIKRLELVHQMLPVAKRVAVVYSEQNGTAFGSLFRQMQESSRPLGLQLAMIDLRRQGAVGEMVARIRGARAQAVIPVGELILAGSASADVTNALLALQATAPLIDDDLGSVEDGFLVATGELAKDGVRRAAFIASSILKGANPASIPVDEPTRIQLWINLRAAKELGIETPQSILLRADRVIT